MSGVPEESLESLFRELEMQVAHYRNEQHVSRASGLVASALDCLKLGDYFGASRIYEDILEIYQELSSAQKRALFSQCSSIHQAIIMHQHGEQLPLVEGLLRDYRALYKIGDWKHCHLVHLQILSHLAFLPPDQQTRIHAHLKELPLPAQHAQDAALGGYL